MPLGAEHREANITDHMLRQALVELPAIPQVLAFLGPIGYPFVKYLGLYGAIGLMRKGRFSAKQSRPQACVGGTN